MYESFSLTWFEDDGCRGIHRQRQAEFADREEAEASFRELEERLAKQTDIRATLSMFGWRHDGGVDMIRESWNEPERERVRRNQPRRIA